MWACGTIRPLPRSHGGSAAAQGGKKKFYTETPIATLGRDRWVASVMTTMVVTFGVMTFSHQLRPLPPGEAVMRAFIFALQIGFAIIGGATVARRFLQRSRSGESRYPPLAELTV